VSELTHRRLAYLRLLDGWQKFAAEHDIDFSLSETSETLEAENKVAASIIEYENGSPLSTVRDAFNLWKEAWINKCKPQKLFT
jgi:hypothetical protein